MRGCTTALTHGITRKKRKRWKGCRKAVQKEPKDKMCLFTPDLNC